MRKYTKKEKSYKCYKKTTKIVSMKFEGILNIEGAIFYDFCELHRDSLPVRRPIVNKIRAAMIEMNFGTKEYDTLYCLYELDEKRIRDSLSSKKYEPKVIENLCEFFGISPKEDLHDFISNYDFEKKDIGHKRGKRTIEDRNNFLLEYKKSWSEETVQAYMDEVAEYEDQFVYDDDELCKIEDDLKRMTFKKLYSIYEEHSAMIISFCDMFVEKK